MKKHWFSILMLSLIVLFVVFFTLIALSPKQDLKKRGFIPCTEALVQEMINCQNQKWCGFKVIINNSLCDLKVIGQGLHLWIKGQQPAPWSNYIFEPELFQDQELKEFYDQNPNLEAQMQNLILLNEDLENGETADPKQAKEE